MSKFSSLTLFVVAATFITLESTAALLDHQGTQLMFIFHQLWEKKLRSILGRKHQSLNCFIIFNSSLPEANLANKNFKDFCLIIKSWQPSFLIDKKTLPASFFLIGCFSFPLLQLELQGIISEFGQGTNWCTNYTQICLLCIIYSMYSELTDNMCLDFHSAQFYLTPLLGVSLAKALIGAPTQIYLLCIYS